MNWKLEAFEKCLVMQKTLVNNEHRYIASVRFESRDLGSLETDMNIYEVRGLIFGNLKNATLLPQTCFNKNQETIVFFLKFNYVRG